MESDGLEVASLGNDKQSSLGNREPIKVSVWGSQKPILLTANLIVVSAILIVLCTWCLWDLPFGNGTLQILVCSLLGSFLALPILLSIWTTLGSQTWIIRIPTAIGTELFLLCVYLGTLTVIGKPPVEVYWIFGIIALAVTVAAQIPLWSLRIWGGVQISDQEINTEFRESQFSISHLLIATTVIAATLPLVQWMISILDGWEAIPGGVMIGFCGIFLLVIGFLAMLSIVIVFVPKLRWLCIGILVVAIPVLPFAVVPPLTRVIGRPFTLTEQIEAGVNVAAFSLWHAMALILAFSLYYALGFRFRSRV